MRDTERNIRLLQQVNSNLFKEKLDLLNWLKSERESLISKKMDKNINSDKIDLLTKIINKLEK